MDYYELINALADENNPNVLDYIDDAATAITELLERAEKAERERDAAVEQLHHCENSCDYCVKRIMCDKETCFGPSPRTGEPTDYWQWDEKA